jgi:hypothetical protein
MSISYFPSPAPHREGERETVGRHGETSATFRDAVIAGRFAPELYYALMTAYEAERE